jgi:hypothetical protein
VRVGVIEGVLVGVLVGVAVGVGGGVNTIKVLFCSTGFTPCI